MLGNDVVDLHDPDAQPESFRARFDDRVFAPVERRAIERDARPLSRRWAHWAAKEAAYKLAKQLDAGFVFSPKALVPKFGAADALPGDRAERAGQLCLPEPVGQGIRELELRSLETGDFVHVVALPAGADWQAVVSAVEPVTDEAESSGAVRRLARRRIARDLGIESARVAIAASGRIPLVEIDGAASPMAISLSHHGGWVACAMTLRSERFPSSAAMTSSEPPRVKADHNESNPYETLESSRPSVGGGVR